jgi:hypothetical protein
MTTKERQVTGRGSLLLSLLLATAALLLIWVSSASAVTFGLVWTGDYNQAANEMEQVQRSGATVFRVPLDRSKTSNGTDWSAYDPIFEHAWSRGITIEPILLQSNAAGTQFPTSGEFASWKEWVKKAVQKYGSSGSFWTNKANPRPATTWEVWNEPNLKANNPGGSSVQPEKYGEFLVATSSAIRAVQSSATVLFGGLYMPGGMYYNTFLERAATVTGEPSSYNAVAIHPYYFSGDKVGEMAREINDVRFALDNHVSGGAGKPLVINELGWPVRNGDENAPNVSEPEQATLLTSSFDWIKAHAAEKNIATVYWYNLRDIAFPGWSYGCGLRKESGDYRPSWFAFQKETGAAAWPVAPSPPTVETKAATGIQEGQATLNGTVNPNGLETIYRFEYGKTTSYGSLIPLPDAGAGAGTSAVTVFLTPNTLVPHTRYHFRLVATNAGGSTYGADQAFTTGVKWTVRNSNSSGSPDLSFWFGLPGELRVSGDWDGNGTSTPGVYNATTGVWKLRNFNTNGPPFVTFQYGGGVWKTPVVGDWNGDGKDTIGVYDPVAGNWNLRDSNSEGATTYSFQYGGGVWTKPVVGDWDGNGKDTVGVYDPSAGNWNLRDILDFGNPTYSFQYGGGVWSGAIAGDWNGDGKDSIGVYDPAAGNWNLRNENKSGPPNYSFQYGGSQYQFTIGDWDGNGTDTPALSEANAPTAIEYQLRNKNESGGPEISFESGSLDQEPLAGEWNGDKITTTGRYEPSTGTWKLRPNNDAGIVSLTEIKYGGSQFKPVVGDWDGNGTDTIGLYEPTEGRWQLRNENTPGGPQLDFKYGGSQFIPVVGDWDGNGTDTIGLYEPTEGRWQLRNENTPGGPQLDFKYGGSQFKPVVGDWDGNGTDTIGLVTW